MPKLKTKSGAKKRFKITGSGKIMAMAHHRNKVARVARSLGLTRSSLYRRLDKYGISYEDTD